MRKVISYSDYRMPDTLRKDILLELGRLLSYSSVSAHEDYTAQTAVMLAGYFGTKFGIAVDSGTTALQLALFAAGVGVGDEVLVPTYTYIATALAVTNIGARPVFVDVKSTDLTLDPEQMLKKITTKTKAVIPVHIHGLCCDVITLRALCQRHALALIEDASQSHGAMVQGQRTGSFGIGCFSLHMSKNLGGVGDAGFIALNDKKIFERISALLIPDSGNADVLSARRTPCGMDSFQAAVLRKKLLSLDDINRSKNETAHQYGNIFQECGVRGPVLLAGSYPVYRDYYIFTKDRDVLAAFLGAEGIETKLGYAPLHRLSVFKDYVDPEDKFPVSDRLAAEVLCLPSFWGISDNQIKHIAGLVCAYGKQVL